MRHRYILVSPLSVDTHDMGVSRGCNMTIIETVNKELSSVGEYMAMLYQMSGRPTDFRFTVKDGDNTQDFVLMVRAVPQDFEQQAAPEKDAPVEDIDE